MNIFEFHKKLIENYKSYIGSFLHIKDPFIRDFVKQAFANNHFWPEPLIQFNPTFEKAKPLSYYIQKGVLHPELGFIFEGYNLYRHQIEAIELGVNGKEFIITSGTGSGKSLTYIAAIFDYVLKQGPLADGKIKAIIVYPMNALINSQYKELEKFKNQYQEKRGFHFPITFAQYTGQENETTRNQIRENPPHILLTNYMMLELLMTRGGDLAIRDNFLAHLRFLVFDELHTYRGRQGADVAMLIRRIKAAAQNPILCIGASATIASQEKSLLAQKKNVAQVASIIFGSSLKADQVVNEYLAPSLGQEAPKPTARALRLAIEKNIDPNAGPQEFENHPTAIWLEQEIALEVQENTLVRRKPQTLTQIAKQLAAIANTSPLQTLEHLQNLLAWANRLNTREEKQKNYLPYKIHQFITQTGFVYSTLGDQKNRKFTLEAALYYPNPHKDPKAQEQTSDEFPPLFPLVFSRNSGHEFYCVELDTQKQKLKPRFFEQYYAEEEKDATPTKGYLLIDHQADENPLWEPAYDTQALPETWFEAPKKNLAPRLKKEKEKLLPRKIYFDKYGNYSFSCPLEFTGYFILSPLIIDPTAGVIYDGKVSEWTKLAKIGTEGRSSAATVLAFETLINLAELKEAPYMQKLLSFTDNRQDASLQAGHFNDFIRAGRLRAAIAYAVQNQNKPLDYANIAQEVFAALALSQEEYALQPAAFPSAMKENEEAFKNFLFYQILQDLQYSWRLVLPNLEQCGLLRIGYKDLEETVAQEELWQDPQNPYPLLPLLPPQARKELLQQIFDYFRKAYALRAKKLEPAALEENAKRIREKLKSPWSLEENEKLDTPCFIRIEKLASTFNNLYAESAGSRSALGKYLIKTARRYKIQTYSNYHDFACHLFNFLARAGWLYAQEAKTAENKPTYIYQLKADTLLWLPGNKQNLPAERIKLNNYKDIENIELKPNAYFQKFYQIPFEKFKSISAKEHTGQISNKDRKEREEKFRKGQINVLFCSPTMELGIDIADLSIVHLRNVPPSPANYAQRSGRAGRNGQAALVVTFCSNQSPHDKHYFQKPEEMVAGAVAPPQINLFNPELLISHLYALIFTQRALGRLQNSLGDWIDTRNLEHLPLKPEVQEAFQLSQNEKEKIYQRFLQIVQDPYFEERRQEANYRYQWFNPNWIRQNIENFNKVLDKALNRWRKLYQHAQKQIQEAVQIIENNTYAQNHEKRKEANRNLRIAERQRDLLLNNPGEGSAQSFSEFYPFRYLASEGVLPGYNFALLPLRVFLQNKDSGGEYVSRPRAIAIAEFGPHNIIYHNGDKYRVHRIMQTQAEFQLEKAKICPDTGYFLYKSEYNYEVDPITKQPLRLDPQEHIHANLLEMTETQAIQIERITCREEERTRIGYQIQTYFAVEDQWKNAQKAKVAVQDQDLLNIHYLPACRIFQLNLRFRISSQKGFHLDFNTGFFVSQEKLNSNQKLQAAKNVKLYTSYTDNALYIQPIKALPLQGGNAGVITLMFALKRAIETYFQVEPNEIASTVLGDPNHPNIFIYESAEGSLGVLSQIMDNPSIFPGIIEKAYQICFYDKNGKEISQPLPPATYDDLLSYYNQFYHNQINRNFIREALKMLKNTRLEILTQSAFQNYEQQYQALLSARDPNSPTEEKFLNYLYQNGLRLPDKAQPQIPDMFVKPDFLYNPNIVIFCDGTPHDDPLVQKQDLEKRKALKNIGYQVLTWHYHTPVQQFIAQRPDIFKKVK
jgi:superfamily II DNA/RNA helicase